MLHIIIKLVLASILFGISTFINSQLAPIMDKWTYRLTTSLYTVTISILYLLIANRSILTDYFKNLGSLTIQQNILFAVQVIAQSIIGLLLIAIAYKENSLLSKPINIGILSSILSLSFVITFIINIIFNLYHKKPLNINKGEMIGSLIIVIGILTIAFTTEK